MNDQPTKAGLYASAAMHAALLAFLVFGFAIAPKFDDAGESIPVETVSQNQFNQIMKGERDAKPMKEAPPEPPLLMLTLKLPEPLNSALAPRATMIAPDFCLML